MKLYRQEKETITTDVGTNTTETRTWQRSLPEGMPIAQNRESREFVPEQLKVVDTIADVQDVEQTGDESPGHYSSRMVVLSGTPKGRKIATSITWRQDAYTGNGKGTVLWGSNPPSDAPAWVRALVEALTSA